MSNSSLTHLSRQNRHQYLRTRKYLRQASFLSFPFRVSSIWRSTYLFTVVGNMPLFGAYSKHFYRSLGKTTWSFGAGLQSPESPSNCPKNVVVAMDGMEEFTTEPLQWALQNVTEPGYVVTLLGFMPWLNIPLSSKTCRDVWSLQLEDLPRLNEKSELRSNVKYLKLQAVAELCRKHGVVLQKKVVMGYPSKRLVIEEIKSLHATYVVFDRHHRKNREIYAKNIPCGMVVMNEEGGLDIIRDGLMIDHGESTPGKSPDPSLCAPKLIMC